MTSPAAVKVPIGRTSIAELQLDLSKLLAGRLLIQGSSGAGKSALLRKIVEETFEYLTTMLVDPEGEFDGLAAHIGATTLRAVELSNEGLTAAAARGREHRLALHIDLSDLEPDQRILKAAAFFAALIASPREHWQNTVLVAVDEAHLLAPHVASSARDAETRRLGIATLTDLVSRGRKRGVGCLLATQRLAKLATSVVSELHNHLIGLNVFDRDVARAAELLGFTNGEAQLLKSLAPGDFYAFGPALSPLPVLAHIAETITEHPGSTPELVGAADIDLPAARAMLDLGGLGAAADRMPLAQVRGTRALDGFLLEPAAAPAARIVAALRRISPNSTTSDQIAGHLGIGQGETDAGIDLLGALGVVDTVPRGAVRIVRLAARLRLRTAEVPVVGLA